MKIFNLRSSFNCMDNDKIFLKNTTFDKYFGELLNS